MSDLIGSLYIVELCKFVHKKIRCNFWANMGL